MGLGVLCTKPMVIVEKNIELFYDHDLRHPYSTIIFYCGHDIHSTRKPDLIFLRVIPRVRRSKTPGCVSDKVPVVHEQ